MISISLNHYQVICGDIYFIDVPPFSITYRSSLTYLYTDCLPKSKLDICLNWWVHYRWKESRKWVKRRFTTDAFMCHCYCFEFRANHTTRHWLDYFFTKFVFITDASTFLPIAGDLVEKDFSFNCSHEILFIFPLFSFFLLLLLYSEISESLTIFNVL